MAARKSVKWSKEDLRNSYSKYEDKKLGQRLQKILEWAIKEGIFLPTVATRPCFGISSKNRERLVSFHADGLICIWPHHRRFYGGKEERDEFIKNLSKINPRKIKSEFLEDGTRDLVKKIQELGDNELENLLNVFRTHCA